MADKLARWSLQDAKAQFSDVVRRSVDSGPQIVSRNGEDVVVVLALAEFRRLTRPRTRSLAAFLAQSPLAEAELAIDRPRDSGRRVRL
ncbi:MAG: type II toxin-antitoxin system prevent-host-death family antitoxin [Gemmatimonadota bacterium]